MGIFDNIKNWIIDDEDTETENRENPDKGQSEFNKQSENSPLFIWEMKALFLLCGRCLKNQKEGNVIYRLYSDFL